MEGVHSWDEGMVGATRVPRRDTCAPWAAQRSECSSGPRVDQLWAAATARRTGVGETRLALSGTHVAGVVQQVVGDGQDRQPPACRTQRRAVEGGRLHLHPQHPVAGQGLVLPLGSEVEVVAREDRAQVDLPVNLCLFGQGGLVGGSGRAGSRRPRRS